MTARYLIGDVLEVLPTLEESSVDLVLTSPPFLALRSYLPADHPDKAKEGGSQSTPGEFIDWLIDVVEALDRVLARHGSICIELGDTYAGSGAGEGDAALSWRLAINGERDKAGKSPKRERLGWPADKSLSLIPELFRFSLVYGFNPLTQRSTKPWRLRNVIRWVRPNPPVGALGDKFRPATSELMVFCRTDEAGRRRYFDLDAVREPFVRDYEGENRGAAKFDGKPNGSGYDPALLGTELKMTHAGAPPLDWWEIPLLEGEEPKPYGPPPPKPRPEGQASGKGPKTVNDGADAGWAWERTLTHHPNGAPPLDWWEIPPGGYSGAHYAVFPEALCVKPIKAMCPEKVCRTCGEPSKRIVENSPDYQAFRDRQNADYASKDLSKLGVRAASGSPGAWDNVSQNINGADRVTLGFTDCGHDNYRPGLVLDPFAGSGTTLAVAVGHGRDAIGIDLDERNARLAEERIGFFLEVVA